MRLPSSTQPPSVQGLLVLGRVGIFLAADRGGADRTSVLVLVAGRQDQQQVSANRSRRLAGLAEKLGRLEGLEFALVVHSWIFNVEGGTVKSGERISNRHPIEILAGLKIFAQDPGAAGGAGRLDDQGIPDREIEPAAGFDGLFDELRVG